MTFYLDTSVLVAALTHEPSTPAVLDWIEANQQHGFAASHWSRTEFSSALALKVRTHQISDDRRAAALERLEILMESFDLLSVEARDFDFAAELSGREGLAWRSGDALHLAIAIRHKLPLRTLDSKFVRGAFASGHDVRLLVQE